MRVWDTFDGIFWISLTTILVGALGMTAKYCLKSKCERFNCCFGAFEIQRRVDLETQEEIRLAELGINEDEEKKGEK
jgi:hypothetical protein